MLQLLSTSILILILVTLNVKCIERFRVKRGNKATNVTAPIRGVISEEISRAQQTIDCKSFIPHLKKRRSECLDNSGDEVDVCVYFASDYNYVVPFLLHHLSIGVSNIWIYNNDENVAWYNHPVVTCLLAEEMIAIQPWFGENGLMRALNHCFKTLIPSRTRKVRDPLRTWGAVFDIDEQLVMHNASCISQIVEGQKSASVAVNWAFYTPEYPLTDFSRTGNVAYLPGEVRSNLKGNSIVLPHDMLVRRMYENPHVKTISRVGCADYWVNEHCPVYKKTCQYPLKPIDPQGHYIPCGPWTPYVDNFYPNVQLNHYWTLSLADFLRKIHRGKGGSYSKSFEISRNTLEFFNHARQKQAFVTDTSFHKYYGQYFEQLKADCPRCFDTSYFFL